MGFELEWDPETGTCRGFFLGCDPDSGPERWTVVAMSPVEGPCCAWMPVPEIVDGAGWLTLPDSWCSSA